MLVVVFHLCMLPLFIPFYQSVGRVMWNTVDAERPHHGTRFIRDHGGDFGLVSGEV